MVRERQDHRTSNLTSPGDGFHSKLDEFFDQHNPNALSILVFEYRHRGIFEPQEVLRLFYSSHSEILPLLVLSRARLDAAQVKKAAPNIVKAMCLLQSLFNLFHRFRDTCIFRQDAICISIEISKVCA